MSRHTPDNDRTKRIQRRYKTTGEMLKKEIEEAIEDDDWELVRELRAKFKDHATCGDEPLFVDDFRSSDRHGCGDELDDF